MLANGSGSSRVRLLLLATSLVALPAQLDAQSFRLPTVAVEQDTARVDRQAPRPIPISEVPLRADEAFSRMQALETQIRSDPDVSLIESNMPDELAAIASAHDRIGQIVLEHLSLRELRVLAELWRGHEDRLEGWGATFEHEWSELQSASSDVADIRASWDLTRDSAVADADTPTEVLDRIDAVIERTETLDRAIRDELSYLLGLETTLNDALDGVRTTTIELEDAQTSVRGRMLYRNHPPLWRLPESVDVESASTVASRLLREDWRATSAFLSENQDRLAFLMILFLMLLFGARRLRFRIEAEGVGEDAALRGTAETLSRPISAATLIVIIIAQAILNRAPVTIWEFVALVSVIPIYRLLPTSSSPLVNRTMRVLLGLFALAALGDMILPPSFEHRVFTLILGIAMIVAAVSLLRGADEDEAKRSEWGRVVWSGLRATVVVAGIAVAAGILGWTLLAEMLVFGLITVAYLGLGLIIGYRVLAGIVRLIPQGTFGRSSLILSKHGDMISERVVRLLRVGAVLLWIWIVLEMFYLWEPVASWAGDVFTGSISVGIVEVSLGKILSFLIVLFLAVWLSRFIRFVLDEEILPRLKLKRGVGNAISTVVQWTILGLGLLTAAGALGLGAQQMAIVAGALGVGIGFGLQNIVNNFVSGLILIFEQPVKVGDKVELTALSLMGEVRRIGIRSSVVRTFDGAEVIVPNANLISSEVVNWTLSDQRRRVQTDVGVAYGTDPSRVRQILLEVASDHPEVLRYPEPLALFLGFGASSLDFRLLTWTANFDNFLRLRSELATATHDALQEAGITIPFPQRDLHVKSLPGTEISIPPHDSEAKRDEPGPPTG